RDGGVPWHDRVRRVVAPDATAGTDLAGRGVIVAGAGVAGSEGGAALADASGWPVLADPRSGCRVPGPITVAAFDALLRHPRFAHEHRPDVVVRLGEPPASKVLAQWLATVPHQVSVETDGVWFDPERTATTVV